MIAGAHHGGMVRWYPWLGAIAMSLHYLGFGSGGMKRLLSVRLLCKTSSYLGFFNFDRTFQRFSVKLEAPTLITRLLTKKLWNIAKIGSNKFMLIGGRTSHSLEVPQKYFRTRFDVIPVCLWFAQTKHLCWLSSERQSISTVTNSFLSYELRFVSYPKTWSCDHDRLLR